MLTNPPETSNEPCDVGSDIKVLANEFPQFNFSTVDPIYPTKTGIYEYSQKSLTERGSLCRSWLRARSEKVIAVVTHHGFLRVGVSGGRYENADFRIFEFDESN